MRIIDREVDTSLRDPRGLVLPILSRSRMSIRASQIGDGIVVSLWNLQSTETVDFSIRRQDIPTLEAMLEEAKKDDLNTPHRGESQW